MHGLQVRVAAVLLRLPQHGKVHIQRHRGKIRAVVGKLRLGQFREFRPRLRGVGDALLPHAHIVVDGAGVDEGIVLHARAVHIYRAGEQQRLALRVLAHGDDAGDEAARVRGQRRPQQVLAVADGHARLPLHIRQNPDVKVVADEPRPRLRQYAVVRIEQAFSQPPAGVIAADAFLRQAVDVKAVGVEGARKELRHHRRGGGVLRRVFTADDVAQQVVEDVQCRNAHLARGRVPLHGSDAE